MIYIDFDEKNMFEYDDESVVMQKMNIRDIFTKDSNNNEAINSIYIKYDINKDAKTFGELFKPVNGPNYTGNYKANSFLINTVVEYGSHHFKRQINVDMKRRL